MNADICSDQGNATDVQSYYFFLRLNVRMVFVLLRVLAPELDEPADGEPLPSLSNWAQFDRSRDHITLITRRIFPILRQYSTWLVSQAHILVAKHPDSVSTSIHIKELWKMLAEVATALINCFPIPELPSIDYLLEEDQNTVGFKPLRDPELTTNANLYIDGNGKMKIRGSDPRIKRSHPNTEMKGRVRDIILCILTLADKEDTPLRVENGRVVYVEEGIQHLSPVTTGTGQNVTDTRSSFDTTRSHLTAPSSRQLFTGKSDGSIAASDSHPSMDNDMHRMVDHLLEPPSAQDLESNETSYGMHSRTANEIFGPIANYTHQDVRQTTPKTLPSLYNTPFAPQPDELQEKGPQRLTTARQPSPFQLSTPQGQLKAAASLAAMTGYSTYKDLSRGRNAGYLSAPVNQLFSRSLGQHYHPSNPMSSNFTDDSSIYANGTPRHAPRVGGGTLPNGPVSTANGNSTVYPGATDFDKATMLQSSLWPTSQNGYTSTPPGGQGG